MQGFLQQIEQSQFSVVIRSQVSGELFRELAASSLHVLGRRDLAEEDVPQRRGRAVQLLVHHLLQRGQSLLR